MSEIINRVAESGIRQINLEDFIPQDECICFDIKSWLLEELILKEKDFREHIKNHDWDLYRDKNVAIICSVDAIIPTWAYMLIASALQPCAKKIFFGTIRQWEEQQILENIQLLDATQFQNQRLVIKGCADKEIPISAFVALTTKLRPFVKSMMYGEPCSTVPVYKAKN